MGLITLVIVARSLLTHILATKVIFVFIGDSGNYKSTLAAVLLSFLFPGTKEDSLTLNFSSTEKGMRLLMSLLKHCLVVIDDYNTDKKEESKVEFLTVDQSRMTARVTAKSATELDQPVKTNTTLVCTAERPFNTNEASRLARVIHLEFTKGFIKIDRIIKLQSLAENGVFFIAMLMFIQWILKNHDRLEQEVKNKYEELRSNAAAELPDGTHPRICENAADFFLGICFFIQFCIENKYLSEDERNKYLDPIWVRIKEIIIDQDRIIANYEPSGIVARSIKNALSEGKLYLKRRKDDTYVDHFLKIKEGEEPSGEFLGYIKNESGDIYVPADIEISVILDVMPRRIQSMLPNTKIKFWTALADLGLRIPTNTSNKDRISIKGYEKSVACYHLRLPGLFEG